MVTAKPGRANAHGYPDERSARKRIWFANRFIGVSKFRNAVPVPSPPMTVGNCRRGTAHGVGAYAALSAKDWQLRPNPSED